MLFMMRSPLNGCCRIAHALQRETIVGLAHPLFRALPHIAFKKNILKK
jgi:hypothetical protein